ncbi:olfactory receptor 10K2-like [Menidia menidia]
MYRLFKMEAKFNITYIIFGGHVEVQRYGYLYFLIMLFVYVLIIFLNGSIVCLIVVHKNLHEPMYVFIAALLINSVLFSTNIYPKLLIDFLSDKQMISYQACLVQVFAFYTLSCSEFLLLAAMSYDRFVSICKPLQYPTIMTKKTVCIFLVSAWVVPACHLAVPVIQNIKTKLCRYTLYGIFCNNTVTSLYCESSKLLPVYGMVALFNIGILPMLFIVFTYVQILFITYQSCGEVRRKAAQTCLPHLLVLINYSCLFFYDMAIVRLNSNLPKTARLMMILQIMTYNPLFNPIIYGLKMREISRHLKKLLLSKK